MFTGNLIISNYCYVKINDGKRNNQNQIIIDRKAPIIDKYFDECTETELSNTLRDINDMGYNAKINSDGNIHVVIQEK